LEIFHRKHFNNIQNVFAIGKMLMQYPGWGKNPYPS
jgi:hypothetical protein